MDFLKALQTCMDIGKELLNFPLQGVKRCEVFSEDGIQLFRDLSDQMQFNRRKKSWGVLGGSLTSIVGGGMAVAGAALIPFTFGASIGLLIAGGGIGMLGAGMSVGFTLDKYFGDKDRSKLAKPILEKFINFQKDLASAIAAIHTTVSVIDDQIEHNITIHGGVSAEVEQKLSKLQKSLEELRSQSDGLHTHEIIHEIASLAGDLSKDALTAVMQPLKKSLRLQDPWFEEKIKLASEKPFELLIIAIEELDKHHNKDDNTFYGFIKKIFKKSSPKGLKRNLILPAGVCLDGTGSVLMRGGMVAARVAMRTADVGQDTARIAANVLRAAKAASIAGCVLNAVGIVLDVGFLGLAAYDLTKKDKEQFPQALEDIAQVMEDLNKLCW